MNKTIYEITINHDGWYQTELARTLDEAQDMCEDYDKNTDYLATFREIDLVDWLMELLGTGPTQLDGDWLVDQLAYVLREDKNE